MSESASGTAFQWNAHREADQETVSIEVHIGSALYAVMYCTWLAHGSESDAPGRAAGLGDSGDSISADDSGNARTSCIPQHLMAALLYFSVLARSAR